MPENLVSALSFLEDLKFNNNRDWFNDNRKRYDAAREAVETFVADVMRQFAQSKTWARQRQKTPCTELTATSVSRRTNHRISRTSAC
jgi:uncharacterized protein (DUF2461 family)